MTKSSRPLFAKRVLQAEWRTRREAAWQLLCAIKDLFPERIEELLSIALGPDPDEVKARVHDWTTRANVASLEVDKAATRFAIGGRGDDLGPIEGKIDQNGNEIAPPTLTAHPFNETKSEFLKRAAKYFDDVRRFYHPQPQPKIVKRDVVHLYYLAAHLVGGYTWAEIAHGDTPFRLPKTEQQTVAGESRKMAALLGIALTTKRGARKGARRHRRLP